MKGERIHRWARPVLAVAVLIAIMLPLTFAVQQTEVPAGLHPAVAQIAVDSPDEQVRLFVQKVDKTDGAVALAEKLGAEVVWDFEFLNAFVVEMAAGDALKLAKSPLVARVSPDGAVEISEDDECDDDECSTSSSSLMSNNTYVWSVNADLAASKAGVSGDGIGVAVIDSGIDASHRCFDNVVAAPFGSGDEFGHGTHVAGIISCDPNTSNMGIAPDVNLIDLKIFDAEGHAYESDVVGALEWVYNNKDQYNIRVINMSLNSTYEGSYHESYMNAAGELLWFNGVVVVVSVGNKGPMGGANTVNTAPTNDPFFIAVGASDDKDTYLRDNDEYAPFSSGGVTQHGYTKPDVVAPGYNLISAYSSESDWHVGYPEKMVGSEYIAMSGTSMSAPVVTGSVALLLDFKPELTPDQVKYLLQNTGGTIYKDSDPYPYLDLYHLVTNAYYWDSFPAANTGEPISQLLVTGDPEAWESVAWNSVAWNSVAWNSVAWNSVAWNSVAWNSVAWNSVAWNSVAWNSVDLNGGVHWGKTRNPNAEPLDGELHEVPDFGEISTNPLDAKPVKPEKINIKEPKK